MPAGRLDRGEVGRLLHDADLGRVAARVAADRARRRVGEIEALGAEHDLLLQAQHRFGELVHLRVGHGEEMERETRRRLLADAGQAAERRGQALDRRRGAHPRSLAARSAPTGSGDATV
jgi:hypothetical protein